jgi:Leucine-rich repeat (LRR) protein
VFGFNELQWLRIYSYRSIDIPDLFNDKMPIKSLALHGLNGLPSTIQSLKKLSILSLGAISIKEVPDWIQRMQNLTRISMGGLPLARLPDFLLTMSKLVHIYADKDVVATSSKAIRELYDRLGAREDLNMIYVGEPIPLADSVSC